MTEIPGKTLSDVYEQNAVQNVHGPDRRRIMLIIGTPGEFRDLFPG